MYDPLTIEFYAIKGIWEDSSGKMETGTATEQMVLYYETRCKLCLIAKTYYSYAPKTTNQGVYRNRVWSCTEFARLLHKIRFFSLGQMNVLLRAPVESHACR
jgi:hypothetical protein